VFLGRVSDVETHSGKGQPPSNEGKGVRNF